VVPLAAKMVVVRHIWPDYALDALWKGVHPERAGDRNVRESPAASGTNLRADAQTAGSAHKDGGIRA
jgi:hypothetical protein